MTTKTKIKLKRKIRALVNARVAQSWKGTKLAVEAKGIDEAAYVAQRNLNSLIDSIDTKIEAAIHELMSVAAWHKTETGPLGKEELASIEKTIQKLRS